MDELLELMEENPPEESTPKENTGEGEIDELLMLMQDHSPPDHAFETQKVSTTAAEGRRSTSVVTPSNDSRRGERSSGKRKHIASKPVSAGIDDKLGIRMVNRIVNSVDLVDLISINAYHSPATLSAMSLAGLSRILIDPPRNIDQATVCGKTNVATVGIVFSNTGTRISARGGAFCVLTIGNFVSGPCVSVMLFGDVYSKFCRTCVPGKVVALINPKLMPTKPGSGRTSVSFSVYDSSQIMVVATAMDYGTCKATVRVKNSEGTWSPTGKCKNYIDKRKCQYCDAHRKQQKQTGKGSLQKLRGQIPVRAQQTVPNNYVNGHKPASTNRFLDPSGAAGRFGTNGRSVKVPVQMSRDAGIRQSTAPKVQNRLLQNRSSSTNNGQQVSRKSAKAMAQQPRPAKRKTGIIGNSSSKVTENLHETLKGSATTSRAAKYVKKRRKVNTDGGGFNGSVPIPRPSQLFQSKSPKAVAKVASSALCQQQSAEAREKILSNQAALARMMKASAPNNPNPYTNKKQGKAAGSTNKKSGGSFYDSIGDVNLEKVKNSKSRFASEVEAEEYAKSRQKVVELEKLETSKEARSKKTNKENNNGFVVTYFCKNCNRTTSHYPNICKQQTHDVRRSRDLTATDSKSEKRTSLHQKSAADGGLRLGAGNEWSRHLKDFHS